MITVIRGTKESQHGILRAAAIIAEMSTHVYHRKTLILQAIDGAEDIEYFINGRVQKEDDDIFGLDLGEKGIDALLLRAEGARVMKNNFDDLVNPTEPEENALDVAEKTTTDDIEGTILLKFDAMVNLMKCAAGDDASNAPYDNVIVVVNGENEELSKKVSKAADKVIIVVNQGNPEFTPEFEDKKAAKKDIDLMTDDEKTELEAKEYIDWKKYYLLINDFEAESTYNRANMKQAYKAKAVYTLPYNVMFLDACRSGNVRRFVLNNIEADKIDNNFPVVEGIKKLLDALYKEQFAKEDERKLELQEKEREEARREKEEIKKLNVRVKPGKKGFFKKEEDSFDISMYDQNPFEDAPKKRWFGKKEKPVEEVAEEPEDEIVEEEYEVDPEDEIVEEYEEVEDEIPEDDLDDFVEEDFEEEDPYEGKTPKELYKECKALEIQAEQKKDREYYIALLEDYKSQQEEDWDDEVEEDWDEDEVEEPAPVVEEPKKTALDLLRERTK